MMNVNVNDTLIANYGAMFPTVETVVEAIEDGVVWHRDTSEVDGTLYMTEIENIRAEGTRTTNGSPIGIFLKNA